MQRLLCCGLVAVLGACASTPAPKGHHVRIDLGYSDRQYFAVQHHDAALEANTPSSGVRARAGSITGRVCGVEVNYDAVAVHRQLRITGVVFPNPLNSTAYLIGWLRVRDRVVAGQSQRQIVGAVGVDPTPTLNPYRNPTVDFWMSPERLEGRIADRRYRLMAQGDAYVGTVILEGEPAEFAINGLGALWSMPAADQAAILPLMLTCAHATRNRFGEPILTVDFTQLVAGEKKK